MCLMDVRSTNNMMKHCLESDIEDCHWDEHDTNLLWYSTENGVANCIDARKFECNILNDFKPHSEAVSMIQTNPKVKGMLMTGS